MGDDRRRQKRVCSEDCWLRTYSPQPPGAVVDAAYKTLPDQAEAARKLFRPIKPWQTRILCIEPAERSTDPLICQLRTAEMIYYEGVVLSDSQVLITYDALSYAWGCLNFTHPLIVNGLIYPITANLSNALRALRDPQQVYYIWVDAVCINQYDDEEKSVQVRRMIAIFRKAQSVIAWLGLKEECGYAAIDYLQDSTDVDEHRDECMPELREIHKGLQELYKRPWLRRTWVRQEVFVARDLSVRCGQTAVPWSTFLIVPRVLDSIEEQLRSAKVDFSPADLRALSNVEHLRQGKLEEVALTTALASRRRNDIGWHGGDSINLLTVLRTAGHFKATNPRDFVYGVLGMTDTATRSKADNSPAPDNLETLPVDYSKSVSEIFQDAAKYLINRGHLLHVLHHAGGRRGLDLDLPSWTPDWRYTSGSKPNFSATSTLVAIWKIELLPAS
ncbi:hypothetical protein W97_03301 [Coniosporium apollinis CBS 100218]|uniref:Heterokaryon incompatibility domain-containing protein n=1 Tax=Coniosporium apollinis (strain CBS 100218) TaxID=1168221 RepID=R7YR07_CONA1|nr:uncharacterized protein W97_03301 [Coniosporium apollinis CBS 100218]EON64071.1 hypothetical protein W97_03301 [Coniosporium apollinis CBS 100218]